MSWSDRRAVLGALAGLPLLTAGCFRPMLAEGGAAAGVLGKVKLPEIDGRFGYFLVKSLEDRLGRPGSTEFRLDVTTSITEQGIAVAQDNSVTRITLVAEADWSLWREGESVPLLRNSEVSQSGYGATSSLYATRQTRRDIERRLARDLGERIARAVLAQAGQFAS